MTTAAEVLSTYTDDPDVTTLTHTPKAGGGPFSGITCIYNAPIDGANVGGAGVRTSRHEVMVPVSLMASVVVDDRLTIADGTELKVKAVNKSADRLEWRLFCGEYKP